MSGKVSFQRRQLSTKQWSENKCSELMLQPKSNLHLTLKVPGKLPLYGLYVYYVVHICDFGMLSYAMEHRDWSGKQWRAERQACCSTRLTTRFLQTVKPF